MQVLCFFLIEIKFNSKKFYVIIIRAKQISFLSSSLLLTNMRDISAFYCRTFNCFKVNIYLYFLWKPTSIVFFLLLFFFVFFSKSTHFIRYEIFHKRVLKDNWIYFHMLNFVLMSLTKAVSAHDVFPFIE